ncbi:ParA family protein [Ancylobacter rudongensis]|uniref:Chromosome partitioning protein n=1 Tax=Ancylobacter rudongensis TaxID=177413 RepID=A0A1G4URG3_9HYPH|nr:ParA family protein [Ancylobacter rudongensis]SCW95555.1 chromosome partitioning protein [Ancylobacter rudongensis]
MADLIIGCLSQKGGVGKSTIARLMARTYAAAGWSVKICDFNTRQKTSVDWCAMRAAQGVEPIIVAEPYNSPSSMKREPFDCVVADGRPDSDQSSLEIARAATLVVVPTGLTLDDLKPQLLFANELVAKGIARERIMFVLNKTTDSDLAVSEARQYILQGSLYLVAEQDLSAKTGYAMAQNTGRAPSESKYPSLNDKADTLAAEIVDRVNRLTENRL